MRNHLHNQNAFVYSQKHLQIQCYSDSCLWGIQSHHFWKCSFLYQYCQSVLSSYNHQHHQCAVIVKCCLELMQEPKQHQMHLLLQAGREDQDELQVELCTDDQIHLQTRSKSTSFMLSFHTIITHINCVFKQISINCLHTTASYKHS